MSAGACRPTQYPRLAPTSNRPAAATVIAARGFCCSTVALMKDITTLLAPEARQTIRLNRQLKQAISQIVPAEALDAVQLCRIENGQLHITLSNASWLSRLRFSERVLLTELESLSLSATGVKWHVLPERVDPPKRESFRQETLEIPPDAPEKVHAAADQFDDKRLRNALKRVAKTMQVRLEEKQQRLNDENRSE